MIGTGNCRLAAIKTDNAGNQGHIMEYTITGRFQTKGKADAAAAALVRYVDRRDLSIFHHHPPGRRAERVIGGNDNVNPVPEVAERPAGASALAAGPAVGAIGKPGGSVDDQQSSPLPRLSPAAVILAVRIARQISKELVVCDLRIFGAEDIHQADGEWLDGDLVEFLPVHEPRQSTA